jgi:hypothetical protein
LKAVDLERGRERGAVAAAVAPLYRGDAAAVPHVARPLPPCPTALGIWPHLPGEPTVGGTPTAVHQLLPLWGTAANVYFSIFLFDYLFFENQRKNIKKIQFLPQLG